MFLGVEYLVNGSPMRVAMDIHGGRVPVATRSGRRVIVQVGQGEPFIDESPGQFQAWPTGNTVALQTLLNPTGLWQEWRRCTRPVKIAVTRYLYADALQFRRQHDLARGQFLQGALISKRLFERVYFVVDPVSPTGDKWLPRIVGGARQRSGSVTPS